MSQSSPHTNELINRAKSGELNAFREIYLSCYDKLCRYGKALNYDPNLLHDTIQDLFVWLIKNPEKLEGIKSLDTYLLKCLRRNIGTYLKREKRKGQNAEKYQKTFTHEISAESQMIDIESASMQTAWLVSQLAQLPPNQKEVIYLRFYEGLSYDEIAEIFSVSKQVVRNSVFRAVKRLRRNVTQDQKRPLF